MKADQLWKAKNKDLPGSLVAIRRAARSARELAMRTGTAIVIWRDGGLVRIDAEALRNQERG